MAALMAARMVDWMAGQLDTLTAVLKVTSLVV